MRLSGMCTTLLEVIYEGWIDKITFEQRLEENESELVKRSKDGAFQTEGPASENSVEVGLCFV